jgi:hypothetical protein
MFHDPIVEEVRAIREKLAAQFDFDIAKIVADAQRRQATSKSRIVSFEHTDNMAKPGGPAPAVSDNILSPQPRPAAEL